MSKITAFFSLSVLCASHGFAQNVDRGVIANGGTRAASTEFSLNATFGQPIIGVMAGDAGEVRAGFWAGLAENVTGVESETERIPLKFELHQNYPNPFNPVTTIQVSLPENAETKLEILDLLGRRVTMLVDKKMAAGVHKITFDASALPSGVYFYRVRAGKNIATRKLTLLK